MKDGIAMIGAGVIGGAIVKSLLKSGYNGEITATRRKVEKLEELKELGAAITKDNKTAAKRHEIIFIYVKPMMWEKF